MTFKEGFDPCRKLETVRSHFQERGFVINRKCRLYENEYYAAQNKLLVQDQLTYDTVRYMTGGDVENKVELVAPVDLEWTPETSEEFLAKAEPLVDAALDKLIATLEKTETKRQAKSEI